MRFSMLYSGEQILSFKSCLVFYAGDSLIKLILAMQCKGILWRGLYSQNVPRMTYSSLDEFDKLFALEQLLKVIHGGKEFSLSNQDFPKTGDQS